MNHIAWSCTLFRKPDVTKLHANFFSCGMTVSISRFAFRLRVNGIPPSDSVILTGSIPELGMWANDARTRLDYLPSLGTATVTIPFCEFVEFVQFRCFSIGAGRSILTDCKRTFQFPDSSLGDPRILSASHVFVDFETIWGSSRNRVSIFVPVSPLPELPTAELQQIKTAISELRSVKDQLRDDVASMSLVINNHLQKFTSGDSSLKLPYDKMIKDLLYEINELKGKVKVIARFRPLIEGELESFSFSVGSDPSSVVVHSGSLSTNSGRSFYFDDVFDESVGNFDFYENSKIKSVVESSVLISNNVCIFSYGQTNSGKSHTVMGSRGQPGIVELALHSIFETLIGHDTAKTVEIEMVEIYRENVFVLIEKSEIADLREGMNLFQNSIHERATASTNLNSTSSRSHCIVAISLSDESSTSSIYVVDLAGSERIKISGAEGDRLAEANSINKSLSTLGQVLNSLLHKKQFIPYRDSKLTKLLAPVFTVSDPPSKVIMIANVSPFFADERETVSTLQFAQRVGSIELRQESSEALAELNEKEVQLSRVLEKQRSEVDLLRQHFISY